jgi:hypothetical protein
MRTLKSIVAVIVFAAVPAIGVGGAFAADLEKFFGTYVGSGTAEQLSANTTDQRDLDVTVEPYRQNGFSIKWITVTRGADGQRTDDSVKRNAIEEDFVPFEDRPNVFVLDARGGLFQKSELPNPLRGEPMRWAKVDGDEMTVFSMAIRDDGGAELQIYRRRLTEKGMDVSFLRMHDDTLEVKMEGSLVRTE